MEERHRSKRKALLFDILLVYVLIMGAYFRTVGLNWGEFQYLHPDERFLVWVGTDISPFKCADESIPIESCPKEMQHWIGLGDYFDAVKSNLNPNNRGHGFYVYGTLPVFLTRYIVQWVYGHSGFEEMTNVGRPLSALADLLTVFLVYLIAARLTNRRVAILAAAFNAVTVLQIQLAHYFTVDTFLNFFTYLAIYFAVRVAGEKWGERDDPWRVDSDEVTGQDGESTRNTQFATHLTHFISRLIKHPFFYLCIAFGLALGCAVASKLNAAPVAIMLPAAFAITFLDVPAEQRVRRIGEAILYLSLGAVVSLLAFRLFQPYAFSGPGFFGLHLNPQWVSNIREQRVQAGGDVDFPPALQWARRPIWFSGKNLVLWGLGLPLGLLAWAGFIWAGWRLLADRTRQRLEIRRHALLWGWTALYFVWQSTAFNPTMRYQLPVYPSLAIFAAWAVIQLWDKGTQRVESYRLPYGLRPQGRRKVESPQEIEGHEVNVEPSQNEDNLQRSNDPAGLDPRKPFKPGRILAILLGAGVFLATFTWAWAFTRIYVRPITRVAASYWIYQNVPGPINLHFQDADGSLNQPVPYPDSLNVTYTQPYVTSFTAKETGELVEVYLAHVIDLEAGSLPKTLVATVHLPDGEAVRGQLTSEFDPPNDLRSQGYLLKLEHPAHVEKDVMYQLSLSLDSQNGILTFLGAAPANESSWDDGLPLRVEGYDGYGGIYQPGLNFEMYWDDNSDKYERIVTTLDKSDYIFMSSNRQWATIPRVPERYPLSSTYYRDLLGCPAEKDVVWCYTVATEGMFKGNLGFELVKVFDSSPRIGPWVINTQFAEEAFTVYDHPKVMIFRKTADYDPAKVRSILGAVDYTTAIHVTPKRASSHPANLMLPSDRLAEQRLGGTWSELFNTDILYNRYPGLALLLWYLSLSVLGWVAYPLVRLALPGLADHGYPLARIFGLLLLSYLVWLAGSFRIPFSRLTISLVFLLILVACLVAFFRQRQELRQEWKERRGYFLRIELLFLAFFILDLVVRLGNPDLWHPWKGGEKPMDFSYFNAVLKSTTFPPYDPWYAGGYLNYYYYGFVFVGVLVKWLGIVPSVAYNLILPTIFAMIAMGAFSLGWNLYNGQRVTHGGEGEATGDRPASFVFRLSPYLPAIAAALGMAVLGNLGTVRMIFQGYQRLVAPGGVIEGAGVITHWIWALRGFLQVLSGANLPYGIGDWYWNPSRAIPAPGDVEPITEFPAFTVLYGDPHAHLFAIPIALLALSFALSIVLGRFRWKGALGVAVSFFLGGLAIGALYPVNLSDIYTYLPVGVVALAYACWRYAGEERPRWLPDLPSASIRLLLAGGSIVLLVALSFLLFEPYRAWYAQAYSAVDLWRGTHTPFWSYLTHWGLFLFVILTWMTWETRNWLASTPVSALRKLTPYQGLIQASLGIILVVIGVVTVWLKVGIAWFVLPLAAWAGVLLLRPSLPDNKRFVLFLVGTGLVLTLMVEAVVVRGDIGRMNTVFKFYLQGWALFAVSAAAALGWLFEEIHQWRPGWKYTWQSVLTVLVAGAALFPLLGGLAKIKDRITLLAPHTLDGMAFMRYAEYADTWGVMKLNQDYKAIRWMQENVKGSPVIVEANLVNLYRWGSRFSIYTGLPGVVGWEWHQQQQRASLPGNWVSDRIAEIETFYTTTDLQLASEFLRKYDVHYIILGQQERGLYAGEAGEHLAGLDKFPAAVGSLWREVYHDGDTVIYEVIAP
jgi:YYY domain-containing protein